MAVARMVVLSMHLKDDNIPAHSEVMNQRFRLLGCIFLFSMVLPFAEHEENGTTHTTVFEEIDTPRFTSSSMNSPMMLPVSLLTQIKHLRSEATDHAPFWMTEMFGAGDQMYNSVMDLSWNSNSYAESSYKLDKMNANGTTAVSIDTGGQGDVCHPPNNPTCLVGGQITGESEVMETTGWNYTPNEFTFPGGLGAKAISLGKYGTTCAIGEDQNAYCWGNSERGKIGHGE